jgi:DNA-binding CsgD family transcriptional regulator
MHKKFMSVKDSIFDIEKNKQIEEMTARFDSEKREQENKFLKKNIKIQQRTKLLLIISLVAIVLIALLLYYFYRLKNKALKQQTKLSEQEQELHSLETARLEDQLFAEQQINKLQTEKLEQKNRELSSRILNTINKNDAMNNILHELELLKSDDHEEVDQCFGKVKQIVKENISLDKDWEQFKLHFDEVNPGFFDALQQQFPQLSSGEQKLCAYYRINLNTKEIARILSVTPSAIQKSRHRLRKKMDISSGVDLHEFMSRF